MDAFFEVLDSSQGQLLIDECDAVVEQLNKVKTLGGGRVDIVTDNAGFELFCDLVLVDFLLSSGYANEVVLQLKGYPVYVSDAMEKDVMFTVTTLMNSSNNQVSILGQRWLAHIQEGRLKLSEHYFWVHPLAMWDMPDKLREDISKSSCVFVKGECNYRRLLGDREYTLDTPFNDVASYWPAPVCALRTMKSEIGCGFTNSEIARAQKADPNWMINGRWGVVQFCKPARVGGNM